MATLTNPITAQNIIDRFADYVVATANADIVWGNNAIPVMDTATVSGVDRFVQVITEAQFGGSTAGMTISATGASITPTDGTITASTIYNTLVTETSRFASIRNARAIGRVTGEGGNNGTRLRLSGNVSGRAYQQIFDTTAKANLNISTANNIDPPDNGGVAADSAVSATNLETFFTNLETAYTEVRDDAVTFIRSVCHSSCHSSCHRNRGRR